MAASRSVIAFSVSGLLVACGAGIPVRTTGPILIAEEQAARPAATMQASYVIRSTGKVVVSLVSNARVAKVRYRLSGDRRAVRQRLGNGRARVVLRRGAKAVAAKGMGTRKLAPSRWIRATKAASRPPQPDRPDSGDALRRNLALAAAQRVFFGHQSVGRNILDGIGAVYDDHGMSSPPIVDSAPDAAGGFVWETEIGENTEPLTKIADFDGRLRDGIAGRVDVALMKLCYVDVEDGTDVRTIFASYRATVAALAADHRRLKLIHVTVPLTTDDAEDNVVRERFNQLIRQQYAGTGRLFDLARVESTRPNGTRVGGTHSDDRYFALYEAYASDSGHLNDEGSKRAASELLRVIARTSQG